VLTSATERGLVQDLGLEAPATDRVAGAAPATFDAAWVALWWDTFTRQVPPAVPAALRLEDRWILHRYADAVATVRRDLDTLRANRAASTLYHFLWDEYCAWYLESIKPRLHSDDRDTARSASAVALVLLASASKLLAPLMPFLAEELWSRVPGTAGLVTTSAFPREIPALRDAGSLDRFALVIEAASAIRTVRSERNVPPGKKAAALVQKDTLAATGWSAEQTELLKLHGKLESLQTTATR